MVQPHKKLMRLFSLIQREYGAFKASITSLTILSFMSGLLEGVGINSIIPLFSFVQGGKNQSTDAISKIIADFFQFFHLPYTLKTLLLFIIGLFVIKAGISFVVTHITADIITRYETGKRRQLLGATIAADWPYLSQQKVGHLDQRLTTDVINSSSLLANISSLILLIANLVVYTLLAVNISPIIALLTLVFGAVIFLLFKPLFYKNRIFSEQVEKLYKEIAHFVNQNVIGMKSIKAMAVETAVAEKAQAYFETARSLNMRMNAVRNITNTLLQPIGLIFIVGIFSFFYKLTAFNFASFAVIVYAINKVFAYIQLVQGQVHGINALLPYVASLDAYAEEARSRQEHDTGTKDFRFAKAISFQDVTFGYTDDGSVLSNISFTIKKGGMIGIIGPSGSGKTTVVDLLLRLLTPKQGIITLDDTDITKIHVADWREHIGYVSQDMFLLNDSIANNIRFYNPHITERHMIMAAKQANIYDFILQQPRQFDTVVGERGVLISGGEKQRIILARILAREPDIIVLDEATSALDNESEALIQQSIENLKGNRTVIVIAHRLSTIMAVDNLIVLEDGHIREQGSPTQLLKDKDSYFYKVYNVR